MANTTVRPIGGENVEQSKALLKVKSIYTFRGQSSSHNIPEITENRKLTDIVFLIVFGVCVLGWISVLGYTMSTTDMDRMDGFYSSFYDSCGNVCGKKNKAVDGVSCSGKDMTRFPILDTHETICKSDCPNNRHTLVKHRCYPGNYSEWSPFTNIPSNHFGHVAGAACIGMGIAVLMLIIFRYFVGPFVWTIVALGMVSMVAVTILLWTSPKDNNGLGIAGAVIMTIATIFISIVLFCLVSKIKLTIHFLREVSKITFSMPLIFLEPILTIISTFLILGIFAFTTTWIRTAGVLKKQDGCLECYKYVPNAVMHFTMYFNVFMTAWTFLFILGCQQMVISGAIAAKYFGGDNSYSPIYRSFCNTIRFHLGSVAFGSLFIQIVTILRSLLANGSNSCCRIVAMFCGPLERLAKYVSSMAYIEVAIHSQSFCRSGIRAINLIIGHALGVFALSYISSFIFSLAKIFVVLVTVGIGYAITNGDMEDRWSIVALGAAFAFFSVHCCFVVLEIGVDTMFVCYCENEHLDDMDASPYLKSSHLKECIAEAQSFEKKKK